MNEHKLASDLLPLYVEDLLSEESRIFVERHLEDCPACRQALADLSSPIPGKKPEQNDEASLASMPLQAVKRRLVTDKRKYWLGLLGFVFLLITLASFYLSAPSYLPYHNRNQVDVVDIDGGKVLIFDEEVTHFSLSYDHDPETNDPTAFISPYRTNLDNLLNRKGNLSLRLEEGTTPYWDSVDGTEVANLLIPTKGTQLFVLHRLALSTYVYLAGIIFVILLGLVFIVRPKLRLSLYLLAAPISYLLGTLIIKQFDWRSPHLVRDFAYILLSGLACYLILVYIIRALVPKDMGFLPKKG